MGSASDVTGIPIPDIATSTDALKDVLESEEGSHLADDLKRKMQELNDRYKNMNDEERADFEKKIVAKFQQSIDGLKRAVHEKVESTVRTKVYSQLAVQVIGVALLIGVIG